MPQTNQDKSTIWQPNSFGKIWSSQYPDGDRPDPDGFNLLKRTDYATAPLGQTTSMPEILQLSSDTTKRSVIVLNKGEKVLRHNLNTVDAGVDPISGQVREGNLTSLFNAGQYYDNTVKAVTLKTKIRFDKSFCDSRPSEGPLAEPFIDGKMFLYDKDVNHQGPYLGLKQNTAGRIRLVSANGVGPWAPAQDGGWASDPVHGWKDKVTLAPLNGLNLTPSSGFFFKTDGLWYEIIFEVRFNPGGIGHNLGRFKSSTGAIYHDLEDNNTDVNGWFPLYINYHPKGFCPYSNPIGFGPNRQDALNNPGQYAGNYAGGFEKSYDEVYSGYEA